MYTAWEKVRLLNKERYGIDGIRLGFWENEGFRKYMEETLEIK